MSPSFHESEQEFGKVYELIVAEKYDEASNEIECLTDEEKQQPVVLFYKGLLAYEKGTDLECVRLLSEFIEKAPSHEKRDYSLFTVSICLINLGMEEDALKILETLPSSYPDLQRELAGASLATDRKHNARKYLKTILQ